LSIWVANTTDGTVTELSPTGATLGTFAAGDTPMGLAFDGMHMWVAGSEGVTEL
jgi:DNA-binding beta-propeller fold protein YncE